MALTCANTHRVCIATAVAVPLEHTRTPADELPPPLLPLPLPARPSEAVAEQAWRSSPRQRQESVAGGVEVAERAHHAALHRQPTKRTALCERGLLRVSALRASSRAYPIPRPKIGRAPESAWHARVRTCGRAHVRTPVVTMCRPSRLSISRAQAGQVVRWSAMLVA